MQHKHAWRTYVIRVWAPCMRSHTVPRPGEAWQRHCLGTVEALPRHSLAMPWQCPRHETNHV
eukprot:2976947-Prymnesium_polylepis.1